MKTAASSHLGMKRSTCGLWLVMQFAAIWTALAQTDTGLSETRQVPVIPTSAYQAAAATNDHTRPAISLSRRNLDFGSVAVGTTNTLSFTVQNVSPGVLSCAANVSAPFSILGGSPSVLGQAQAQVITVQYAPKSLGMHMAVVHLTDGATVTVVGSSASSSRKPPRRREPTEPRGLRLLARQPGSYTPA
jgi:hypothetical protein